jgi:hypothetical protein
LRLTRGTRHILLTTPFLYKLTTIKSCCFVVASTRSLKYSIAYSVECIHTVNEHEMVVVLMVIASLG